MPFVRRNFDEAVWGIVSSIAPGQVMSYGEVARVAGFPRHARMVSRAMSRCAAPLPWHRVVRSDRTLAFMAGSESYNMQKELLEKEGIQFIGGKVVSPASGVTVDVDEVLWGPSSA